MSNDLEARSSPPDAPSPVRAGRTRLIAIVVAAVVVLAAAGIFAVLTLDRSVEGLPVVTSTPRPTASEAPSPAPTPMPSVVLDGDCSRLVAEGTPVEVSAFSMNSDEPTSARLLGGLICSLPAPETLQYLQISVYPEAAVPATVRELHASWSCTTARVCHRGEQLGDFWYAMSASPVVDPFNDFESTRAELQALSDDVVTRVAPALQGAAVQPTEREGSWWTAECATLTSTVESVVGSPLEQQFPGDAVPEGVDWDILVAAGLQSWCPWTNFTDTDDTLVEVFVQPGVGAPDPAQLAGSEPIDVTGADASWTRDFTEPRDVGIVSVVGPNRLLIRVRTSAVDPDAASRIAAALIAHLNAS